MSKILRIYAKKGNTTAQEDFLGNLERGLSRSLTPEPIEDDESTSNVATATPVEEEVKPFSDPIPTETKPDEVPVVEPELQLDEDPFSEPAPKEPPAPEETPPEPSPVQFDIPFEEPLETPVITEGNLVTESMFRETIGIINTRVNAQGTQLNSLNTRLYEMSVTIKSLTERITSMALNLDVLTEAVTQAKTVQASAVELINKVVAELESVSAELAARKSEPPIDTSGIDALASELKESTDALAAAVSDSIDVKATHKVVLNANNPDKATVEVVMPEVLPEVVEATVEPLNPDGIDLASPDPQARVVVDEAHAGVEGMDTAVLETAEGEANVTVAVDPSAPVAEVVDAVKEAYDATPEVTAVPTE